MVIISIVSTIIELAVIVALIIAFFSGYEWMVLIFLIPFLVLFSLIRKTILFGRHAIICNFNKISYKNIKLIEIDSRPTRGAILSTPIEIIVYYGEKRRIYYLGLFFFTEKIESKIIKICQEKCIKCKIKTNR